MALQTHVVTAVPGNLALLGLGLGLGANVLHFCNSDPPVNPCVNTANVRTRMLTRFISTKPRDWLERTSPNDLSYVDW